MLEFSFSCGGESGAVLGSNLPSIVGSHQRMGATNNSKGFFLFGMFGPVLGRYWAETLVYRYWSWYQRTEQTGMT
jgi:hypothetical protein